VALMARVKNSTFAGSPMVDVDVDALTFKRTIKDAIGDTARAYDRMTGSNAETNTMIHDGAGRGCLLGIPWANQWINRSLSMDGSVTGIAKNGGDGATYRAARPFFVPTGETRAIIRLQANDITHVIDGQMRAIVRDTSGTVVVEAPFSTVAGTDIHTAVLDGLAAGEHILTIEAKTVNREIATVLKGISITTGRRRGSGSATPGRSNENVIGVTDPGTLPLWFRDYDEALFDDGLPISSYHTSGLNRWQNGMYEYGGAWPAGDDLNYTHADDADPRPTRSEFRACTRAGFASEGLPDFPLLGVFLGAAKRDGYFAVEGVEPPVNGMVFWYAPWPKTSTGLPLDIAKQRIEVPDFPGTDMVLHVAVLAIQGPSFAGTWSIDCDVGAGTATGNFSAVGGGTNLLRASISLSAVWTSDAPNTVAIGINRTAGVRAVDEIAILGYELWFKRA